MNTPTSRDFFKTWLEIAENNKTQLLKKWGSNSEFTSFVIHEKDSIVCQIAEKLNLLCYNNDYYSIDTVFYNRNDIAPETPSNKLFLRDIKIAFEHENYFNSKLYEEVTHLLITNSELKVLVSYPKYEPDDELKKIGHIIKGTRHEKDISENERFLIILGYHKDFSWEGYIYDNGAWIKL